jgi:hypothetical protein
LLNRQLRLFCSEFPQPSWDRLGDAWQVDWSLYRVHINPPWDALQRVLDHIDFFAPPEAVVILPIWKAQPWCTPFFQRATRAIAFTSSPLAFLPGRGGSAEPLGHSNWKFAALLVLNGGRDLPALGLPFGPRTSMAAMLSPRFACITWMDAEAMRRIIMGTLSA